MQRWILFFQNTEISVGFEEVLAGRQDQCASQDRLQKLCPAGIFGSRADSLSNAGLSQSRHRADFTRLHFLSVFELASRIEADLFHLLRTALLIETVGHRCFDLETSAGQFHPSQSCAAVSRDLEDPGAEFVPVYGRPDHHIERREELCYSLFSECSAEQDGEQFALRCQRTDLTCRDRFTLQISAKEFIVTDCDLLLHIRIFQPGHQAQICVFHNAFAVCCAVRCTGCRVRHDVDTVRAQLFFDSCKQCLPVCAVLVHLVDEHENRHAIVLQKPPKHPYLPVYAVRRTDDQYSAVQDSQYTLHLR